jgi:hypothetical protein
MYIGLGSSTKYSSTDADNYDNNIDNDNNNEDDDTNDDTNNNNDNIYIGIDPSRRCSSTDVRRSKPGKLIYIKDLYIYINILTHRFIFTSICIQTFIFFFIINTGKRNSISLYLNGGRRNSIAPELPTPINIDEMLRNPHSDGKISARGESKWEVYMSMYIDIYLCMFTCICVDIYTYICIHIHEYLC